MRSPAEAAIVVPTMADTNPVGWLVSAQRAPFEVIKLTVINVDEILRITSATTALGNQQDSSISHENRSGHSGRDMMPPNTTASFANN